MVFKYNILPEKQLILQYFGGCVSFEDLLRCLQVLIKDELYNPTYKGITLLSDAEVGLTTSRIKDFSILFGDAVKNPQGLGRLALIAENPAQTALAQIFQYELIGIQDIKVFSTFEGVCGWLSIEEMFVKEAFDRLKLKEPI